MLPVKENTTYNRILDWLIVDYDYVVHDCLLQDVGHLECRVHDDEFEAV